MLALPVFKISNIPGLVVAGILALVLAVSFTPVTPALAEGGGGEGASFRASKKAKKTTRKRTSRRAKKTSSKRKTGRRTTTRNEVRRVSRQTIARSRQILVTFSSNTDDATINAVAQDFGLQRISDTNLEVIDTRLVKFRTPRRFSDAQRQQLANDARTQRVQSNFIYRLSAARVHYAARTLKLPQVHEIAKGSGIRIAVLDGGIYSKHPAIAGAIKEQFDAVGKQARTDNNHGTGIASIIAAQGKVMGVAPEAHILSARVFGRETRRGPQRGETFHILRGLDWAVKMKAAIINMSFAGPKDPLFYDVLKAASARGIALVAAAGNQGPKKPVAFPAAYYEVIASTAIDSRNRLYRHANRGEQITIAAPGVDILVARKTRSYGLMSGTSAATAYVSGSIALIMQKHPSLRADTMNTFLGALAHDLGDKGRDRLYGYGLLDVYRAINGSQ